LSVLMYVSAMRALCMSLHSFGVEKLLRLSHP